MEGIGEMRGNGVARKRTGSQNTYKYWYKRLHKLLQRGGKEKMKEKKNEKEEQRFREKKRERKDRKERKERDRGRGDSFWIRRARVVT